MGSEKRNENFDRNRRYGSDWLPIIRHSETNNGLPNNNLFRLENDVI